MSTFIIQNLRKSYFQGGVEIPVLKGIDLSLEAGESLSIIGASGAGKSTFLHCVGLIETLDEGSIRVEGESLNLRTAESRALARRRSIGFVFQHHYLMSELTAVENVMVPLLVDGVEPERAEQEAVEFLKRLQLGHRLTHRPAQLSGGEQQRVSIARALCRKPRIILADEPTGNLDPETAHQVFDLLRAQCEHLGSILMVATHNLELAVKLKQRRKLHQGKLIEV